MNSLLTQVVLVVSAAEPPKDWRNIGPKWNFPFAPTVKMFLGWGFAFAAVAGVVIALTGVVTAIVLTLRGREGAGKAWLGFVLGLILITIGLGGSALMFDMANLVKLRV